MSSCCDLSLVIACYKDAGHLEESVQEIRHTLECSSYTYELIFIEDKGEDGCREIIEDLVHGEEDWQVVYHETNVGRGGSVSEGFRLARGRVLPPRGQQPGAELAARVRRHADRPEAPVHHQQRAIVAEPRRGVP